jgi:hypothetical protein
MEPATICLTCCPAPTEEQMDLEVRACPSHQSGTYGSEDVFVTALQMPSGTAEAGEDGAAWAEFLNRDSPYRKRRRKR